MERKQKIENNQSSTNINYNKMNEFQIGQNQPTPQTMQNDPNDPYYNSSDFKNNPSVLTKDDYITPQQNYRYQNNTSQSYPTTPGY